MDEIKTVNENGETTDMTVALNILAKFPRYSKPEKFPRFALPSHGQQSFVRVVRAALLSR